MSPHQINDYASAARYLAAGKSKTDRPLPGGSQNTRLIRLDADRIAVRLYGTNVVTYHRQGYTDLYHGGWATRTTADRINAYAPVRVSGVSPMQLAEPNPRRTPPRVTKCRTCSGAGISKSHGAYQSMRYPPGPCYRCQGTGRADYGSQPLYRAFDASRAIRVSSRKGTFRGYVAPAMFSWDLAPPTVYKATPTVAPTPARANVESDLRAALPALAQVTGCPACDLSASISAMVVHLNDGHRWTREQVADWLDTLSADLSFPIPDHI